MNYLSKDIMAVGNNAIFVKGNAQGHTAYKYIDENGLIDGKWLPWGEDNLYPQNLIAKVKFSGTAVGGLEVLTAAHFGAGLKLYQCYEDENEEIILKERLISKFPEIEEFMSKVNFDMVINECIVDYEAFRIFFVEFIVSPNGEKVLSVKRLQASHCRFEKPNKQGIIEKIGVNTDWEQYNSGNTISVPCFSQYTPVEELKGLCKQKNIQKFVIPVVDTLLIEKTYPSVGWHASFKNGWMDVVLSIPAYKKAIFKNQLNIKYVIHVADDYFAHYYRDTWDSFSDAEKNNSRQRLVELIDETLKGQGGAGSSITSPFFRDKDTGKEIKGIQVEPITQPNAQGDFLSDGFAGNTEILFAMGVDPSLLGQGTPGGKNLSGSGSDKREAFTILCSRLPIKHVRTLLVFEIIKKWNNWPRDIVGKFPNINLTTLDKNPNGQVKIVN